MLEKYPQLSCCAFLLSSVSGTQRRGGAPHVRRVPLLPGALGLKLLGGFRNQAGFFSGGGGGRFPIT